METRGVFAPETEAEARERYATAGEAAQVVVREVARAMEFDEDEYERRVTPDVVETARDALFASLLRVTLGSREEFEAFLEANPNLEVVENGSPDVEHAVWHTAPHADLVVAATYHEEPDAAVAALRRQAFGECYRDLFEGNG